MAEAEEMQVEQRDSEAPERPEAKAAAAVVEGATKIETAPKPTFVATDPPRDKHYWWGTGRRKTAVARVRIRPGTGKFLVNKREISAYFAEEKDRQAVVSPLETTNMIGAWDVWVNVSGGGGTGQAGAVLLGLSRAVARAVPEAESALRDRGLLTRDARMVERKKYGQPGARKRFQFSKR